MTALQYWDTWRGRSHRRTVRGPGSGGGRYDVPYALAARSATRDEMSAPLRAHFSESVASKKLPAAPALGRQGKKLRRLLENHEHSAYITAMMTHPTTCTCRGWSEGHTHRQIRRKILLDDHSKAHKRVCK